MYIIGKIDTEKYKLIVDEFRTDEVIITEERIEHIILRRGQEFYNKYANKFDMIISDPDYIFKDKKNTALVCKGFFEDGVYINIALRLVVATDNPDYKNSIITAVRESKKRFEQRLRNNLPVYKKE